MLILFKRFLRKSVPSKTASSSQPRLEPEQYVLKIKLGDERLREQFIAEYYPYIAKVTSRFCKRYIEPGVDDEFSVALLAFNEAIEQYDSAAGASFLGFAKTVIQRRLIDHARKEQRHLQVVPYSAYDSEGDDGSVYNALDTMRAMAAHEAKGFENDRKAEIAGLNQELEEFGISFAELVEQSPKHADSRKMLIGIASMLANDEALLEGLRATGRLPVKELMNASGVSRKTVERNRKYIISIALVLSGTYPYMKDYLTIGKEEAKTGEEVGG
ncbi:MULTISPECIES: RNA polymerase sigma factor SigI [unclassified Paenibacillus]|uniref:RNA polymerase sigma factor SigI n=1 Tax=unclassified Paenibacillus TaxID=185978 RepID=UPI0036D22FC5